MVDSVIVVVVGVVDFVDALIQVFVDSAVNESTVPVDVSGIEVDIIINVVVGVESAISLSTAVSKRLNI